MATRTTDEARARIAEMWWAWATMGQIAKEMGLSRSAVAGIVNRNKMPRGPIPARVMPTQQPNPRPAKVPKIGAGNASGATGSAHRASDADAVADHHAKVNARPAGKAMPDTGESEGSPLFKPRLAARAVKLTTAAEAVLALRLSDCRWPIGDPHGGQFRFCGAPRKEGVRTRYCEHHLALAWGKETREAHGLERPKLAEAVA
jgi:GcrA cell cycle regulator